MRSRLLASLLVAILVFSGCGTTKSPSEPQVTPDTTVDTTPDTGLAKVSGAEVPYSISYDTSKWTLSSTHKSKNSEYEFDFVDGSVHALIVPESTTLDLATIRQNTLDKVKSIAPDARISFEEDRTVNGVPVHVMKTDGTLDGIGFEYYGYYYTGKAGTIQFISYTRADLTNQYEADITELLNGLTVTE